MVASSGWWRQPPKGGEKVSQFCRADGTNVSKPLTPTSPTKMPLKEQKGNTSTTREGLREEAGSEERPPSDYRPRTQDWKLCNRAERSENCPATAKTVSKTPACSRCRSSATPKDWEHQAPGRFRVKEQQNENECSKTEYSEQ